MKSIVNITVTVCLFIGSIGLFAQGSLQKAMAVVHADRINLIDGTNLTWSNVKEDGITFQEIGADADGLFTLQMLSTPSQNLHLQLLLVNDDGSSGVDIQGGDVNHSDGSSLYTSLVSGDIIKLIRCGTHVQYYVNDEVVHVAAAESVAVEAKLVVINAGGESLYLTLDTELTDGCTTLPDDFSLPGLSLTSYSDGQDVYLRWALPDYRRWLASQSGGFKIERTPLKENGVYFSPGYRRDNTIILATILPLAEASWDASFPPDHDPAMVAKGALYEADQTLVDPSNSTLLLKDALQYEASNEARYVFALLAAEQDFAVASGLALGYLDQTADPNIEYVYKVSMVSSDLAHQNMLNYVQAGRPNINTLPTPEIEEIIGKDLGAEIIWDVSELGETYTFYEIERSTDNVNFTKTNEHPFIPGDQEEERSYQAATYIDDLPANNVTYYYRIYGMNSFGFAGPPSPSVEVVGKPPRLALDMRISEVDPTETTIEIKWNEFETTYESSITGFVVLRAEVVDGDYQELTSATLPVSARSYTDVTPLSSGYYIVRCVDQNGYEYSSIPTLGQTNDITPPAVPAGLTAEFVTSTDAKITWDPVPDEDLKGYKIFASNFLDGTYIQINEGLLAGETFIHTVDPTVMIDNIYFKVQSSDTRANCSDLSASFGVARPDLIPPSDPLLHKAMPTPDGIQLGWKFSGSDDVDYHVLQRKPTHMLAWRDILNISKNEEDQYLDNLDSTDLVPTSYIDDEYPVGGTFDYRILAYDDVGNESSSAVITVRPYVSRRRDALENFNVDLLCTPSTGLSSNPAYQLLDYILVEYEQSSTVDLDTVMSLISNMVITMSEYNDLTAMTPAEIYTFLSVRKVNMFEDQITATVTLSWLIEMDDSIRDYQLYRSVNGSDVMLYKTLTSDMLTNYEYVDEDVKPGYRYLYKVMARYKDGGFSPFTELKMVKVPKGI